MAERLRHVADGVLRPVLDDVAHLRGALAPVFENTYWMIFAPLGLEADVDVGLASRSSEMKRSKGRLNRIESIAVIPSR